jgi:SAM-dependent methyltransferase
VGGPRLNDDPALPFPDASFDAVTCCVSVDYLVRPVEVFAEASRVLRPDGPFVVTFSNRCFPTKAIRGAGWRPTTPPTSRSCGSASSGRAGSGTVESALRTPLRAPGDPLWAVWADDVIRAGRPVAGVVATAADPERLGSSASAGSFVHDHSVIATGS